MVSSWFLPPIHLTLGVLASGGGAWWIPSGLAHPGKTDCYPIQRAALYVHRSFIVHTLCSAFPVSMCSPLYLVHCTRHTISSSTGHFRERSHIVWHTTRRASRRTVAGRGEGGGGDGRPMLCGAVGSGLRVFADWMAPFARPAGRSLRDEIFFFANDRP